MRRSLRDHRAKVVALAIALVAGTGAGVGVAQAVGRQSDDTSLATTVWRDLTAEQKEAALKRLAGEDEEKAKSLAHLMDNISSGGRVPVAAGEKVAGYVEAKALDANRMPRSGRDLMTVPVTGESGDVVGYWGGPMGFVEKGVAEATGLDVARLARERGLNPDGTVLDDLLRRVPKEPPPSAVRAVPGAPGVPAVPAVPPKVPVGPTK